MAAFPLAAAGINPLPCVEDENAYALEVTGDNMQPLYRDGNILIVSPQLRGA